MPGDQRLSNLGQSMAAALGLRATRQWLNNHLEKVTPAQCHECIRSNTKLWSAVPKNITKNGVSLAQRHRAIFKRFYDSLTIDLLMDWLKKDRPDLFSIIINTPGGVEWLDGQLQEVKVSILDRL
ncbi:MAG: hypothetical protein PHU95_05470 [Candidatus Thermoplasmatota archaeon]|nr:hypothetical protein [Candidatus Thermoplasmatota archaeon]MDD5778875.1 hypothetical protein [Candidatus Thermoplasmatota archaeon]